MAQGRPSNDESQGRAVRDLVRGARTATLATVDSADGHPYASLVEVATLADGRPVMLLSGLARHTRNLLADTRATLLFDQREGYRLPLTALRAALIGRVEVIDVDEARRRYIGRFPAAREYADFADFGFWCLTPDRVHTVAGFGRISELDGQQILLKGDRVREKRDGEEALLCKVNALADNRGVAWRAIGIDIEGIDYETAGEYRRCGLDWDGGDENSLVETIVSTVCRQEPS